jgi:tetratricopeptide (TPR) repeat protein
VNKILRIAALLALTAAASSQASARNFCGELKNGYGPFDYRHRAELAGNFELVESAHFTEDVQNGLKGNSSSVGGDLDYTLRAIPNHHRGLTTLANIALRDHAIQVGGMHWPVECYFDRALRFTPDDADVYAIYGSYMYSLGKTDRAMSLFKQGEERDADNATINYNLGLVYLKQGDYAQARAHAKKAYAHGFPLAGLKNKLAQAGQWEQDKPE